MPIIEYIAFTIPGIYFIIILGFAIGWKKLSAFQKNKITNFIPVSIVVACRNEERNIAQLLECLVNQDYPHSKTEIILVDDHSEDNTGQLIKEYIKKNNFIAYKRLPEYASGKKAALALGIQNATSEIILTTDADCIMHKTWVSEFVSYYQTYKPLMISGPVVLKSATFFQKMQSLEFLSLVGSGAGAIGINHPIMNNGANLLFKKSLFEESGQQEKYASGDDVFLLLNAKKKNPKGIHFLKSKQATVYTNPAETLPEFFSQRIRWTSKSKAYKGFDIIFTALVVSSTNLILACFLLYSFFNHAVLTDLFILFGIKSVADLMILIPVSKFLQQQKLILLFVPLQVIYPFYIVFTTIFGLLGNFHWKNRHFKEKG